MKTSSCRRSPRGAAACLAQDCPTPHRTQSLWILSCQIQSRAEVSAACVWVGMTGLFIIRIHDRETLHACCHSPAWVDRVASHAEDTLTPRETKLPREARTVTHRMQCFPWVAQQRHEPARVKRPVAFVQEVPHITRGDLRDPSWIFQSRPPRHVLRRLKVEQPCCQHFRRAQLGPVCLNDSRARVQASNDSCRVLEVLCGHLRFLFSTTTFANSIWSTCHAHPKVLSG